MTQKEITFKKYKFSREMIELALNAFYLHIKKEKGTFTSTSLSLENESERITLSDFPSFWIAYADEEIIRASISINSYGKTISSEIMFRFTFRYGGDTSIEIKLPELSDIDEIFNLLKIEYEKKNINQTQDEEITFRDTRRLPSLEVNTKLINKIEDFLVSLQNRELFAKLKKVPIIRNIILYDDNGVLTIPSIKSFNHELFSDSTRRIDIDQSFGNSLIINICFCSNQSMCDVTIKAHGSDSKEIAETVFNGFFEIISENKITVLAIKNPVLFNTINFICLAYAILSLLLKYFYSSPQLPFALGAGLIFMSLFILDKIYPYLIFNTKKNQNLKTIRNYVFYPILLGVISSFIYDFIKTFTKLLN